MASFFFFTEANAIGSQTDTDAFGPVAGSAETQFRVTSTHRPRAGKTPNAYAVCGGLLLAQDAGNNLLNLILKPTDQPPFAFPKIKFFIYRGIKRNTLVSGDDIAPSVTNDLTKSIWKSQQDKNADTGTSDNPSAKALGIDISGNGSIDDVFYRENVSHQLQTVRAGWSLGEFDSTQFGFEILVEAIGFDPELPLVRTAANIITVAALPVSPTPTQAQEFEHWHNKEAILNYIDPCAFFGGFYFHTLEVKYTDGTTSPIGGNGVYDEVLKGAHLTALTEGVFFNRNRTYLDIRNEYNHSINYFKNYGTYSNTDINCAFAVSGSLTPTNYYASTWPLMFIDNGAFPANNASVVNLIRLALPAGAGDNPFPTLYIATGYLASSYPYEPKEKAKLIDLSVSLGITDEVTLVIPNRSELTHTTAISFYVKLKYLKRRDPTVVSPPVSSGTVIRAGSFLDNVFAPFDMKIPFANPAKVRSVIYDAEVFVDMTRVGGYDYIGSVGIVDDGTTYSFILHPTIVRRLDERKSALTPFSGAEFSSPMDIWSWFASQLGNREAQKSNLQFPGGVMVDCVKIVDKEDAELNPEDEAFLGYTIISCSKSQLTGISRTIFASWSPIYLGAHNLVRYADELGQEYWNFNISLWGFGLNGSNLEVKEVVSNISIYVNGNLTRGDDIQVGTQEITIQGSSLPHIPPVPPIKHVFVLMLENRSFDHMLGFSGITGTDAITRQPTAIVGASSANTNPYGSQMVGASTPADFQGLESSQGPPHEFLDVLRQLCGTHDVDYIPSEGVYPPPNNLGFIYSYASGNLESEGDGASLTPEKIMKCYAPAQPPHTPAQLPVLTTLAQEFAVCDHWYSSVPGPTWPNRFFVHAATSGGLAESPLGWRMVITAGPLPVDGFEFEHGHIYDRLNQRGMDWRVYDDNGSQVISLEGMTHEVFSKHHAAMDKFTTEVMSENYTPIYTFIEPDYGYHLNGQFLGGTSQHPRDDVRPGEMLIKRVYETIRNSPHWNNSVLVITYDEHGGFYDHDLPPVEEHPPGDDNGYDTSNKFNFGRLGVRVPAIIISPLIPKGTIDHTRYDHSSVLATLERMFRLAPLTERDKHANDFRHLFSLTIPRVSNADAPRVLPRPPATFPNAAGMPTYRGMTDSDINPPIAIPPPGGRPIDDPLYRRLKKHLETDLELLLANDPTLHLPTTLSDDRSADLMAWLHAAFRRRLAVLPEIDLLGRERVLRDYCAVQTAVAAQQFIDLADQEVRDFRASLPV